MFSSYVGATRQRAFQTINATTNLVNYRYDLLGADTILSTNVSTIRQRAFSTIASQTDVTLPTGGGVAGVAFGSLTVGQGATTLVADSATPVPNPAAVVTSPTVPTVVVLSLTPSIASAAGIANAIPTSAPTLPSATIISPVAPTIDTAMTAAIDAALAKLASPSPTPSPFDDSAAAWFLVINQLGANADLKTGAK